MATWSNSPRLVAAVLVVAIGLGYANTFGVPFVFDDVGSIAQNPTLERFSTALHPPDGLSVTGRPLVNLSFALNHAISGRDVWSYHALNLALHFACALTLFGLVRRVLETLAPARDVSNPLTAAFASAFLWSLHPLHTGAVTYVMQRTELLASLCCLVTLHAFQRSAGCPSRGLSHRAWLVVSVAGCALGMMAKEIVVVLPVLAFLFDRTFVSGSFRAAVQRHGGYHLALAGTWAILAALILGTANRGESAGFHAGMPWMDYALTQLYAIPHYLWRALWPAPLVFDYGAIAIRDLARLIPGAIAFVALIGATVLAFRRSPRVAFCCAWFWLLLAPSSSVVPVATQTIAEHRVYLALAAPIVLLVVALDRCLGRRMVFASVGTGVALAVSTFARNADYASVLRLWSDTVARAPANPRAHYNHALALLAASDERAAAAELSATLALDPNHASAHHKLALLLLQAQRSVEALPHLEAAVRLAPNDAAAHYNLGRLLAELERYRESLVQFEEAARLDPTDVSARNNAARLRAYLRR